MSYITMCSFKTPPIDTRTTNKSAINLQNKWPIGLMNYRHLACLLLRLQR